MRELALRRPGCPKIAPLYGSAIPGRTHEQGAGDSDSQSPRVQDFSNRLMKNVWRTSFPSPTFSSKPARASGKPQVASLDFLVKKTVILELGGGDKPARVGAGAGLSGRASPNGEVRGTILGHVSHVREGVLQLSQLGIEPALTDTVT